MLRRPIMPSFPESAAGLRLSENPITAVLRNQFTNPAGIDMQAI
jgi:hypothetical protein